MIMKKFAWVLILGLNCLASISQNNATISGRVFDQDSGQPLPFATLLLLNNTYTDTVGAALTTEDGRFVFQGLGHGEYIVMASFVGYKKAERQILVGRLNENFDLGRIELAVDTRNLSEVVVEARRSIVSSQLDKMSYSVASDPGRSGGTILDAMRGMPGLAVTNEGKVLLRGSDKVSILIDGKQSSLTGFGNQKGLDGIPASQIERIEVLNNPSAKYDAAGMAGIINIVYKKEKQQGFNAELGFNYGLGTLNKRQADLPTSLGSFSYNPKYTPGLNLNYRNERVNVFAQTEVLTQRNLPNNEFTTRRYDDGREIASQVPENRRQTHYLAKAGVDVFLNENNTLTFSGIYDYESHIDSAQVAFIDLATMDRNRLYWWKEFEITGFMNVQMDYKHQFSEPGHSLSGTVQYTRGWEDEEYQAMDSSAVRQSADTTHILAIEHTTSFLVDYVKPLGSGRLEAGSKFQVRRLPVEYSIGRGLNSIIYPGLGDWTYWGENLYAGYFNYIYERKQIEIEGGLRLEETSVFYNMPEDNYYYQENDKYGYFGLFPNIRTTWKINSQHGLSAFYNRRVDRPGEPELRIYPKSDDPELMKVGNPYLRPQFTQRFELAYKFNWSSGSLFAAAYHKRIDDTYLRIYATDTTQPDYSIVNKIYQNVGHSQQSGGEFLFTQQLAKNWKMNASFNLYYSSIDAYEGEILFPYKRSFSIDQTQSTSWDSKVSTQMKVFKDWQLQLSYVYYSAQIIPQGKQLARSSFDIAIKLPVLKNKGEISLSAMDLFNKFGVSQVINGDGFVAEYQNFYETQVVRAGFKYRF